MSGNFEREKKHTLDYIMYIYLPLPHIIFKFTPGFVRIFKLIFLLGFFLSFSQQNE